MTSEKFCTSCSITVHITAHHREVAPGQPRDFFFSIAKEIMLLDDYNFYGLLKNVYHLLARFSTITLLLNFFARVLLTMYWNIISCKDVSVYHTSKVCLLILMHLIIFSVLKLGLSGQFTVFPSFIYHLIFLLNSFSKITLSA